MSEKQLLGQEVSPELEQQILATLKARSEIHRVSYRHVEYVGPSSSRTP